MNQGPHASPPVLEIHDLEVQFATEHGWRSVVTGVDLTLHAGRARALVGESGSGKTVTALSVLGLLPRRSSRVSHGCITFDGHDLRRLDKQSMRDIRGRRIAMIFQDPMTSLNPALTVGYQIAEVLRRHEGASRRQASRQAVALLDRVGIPSAAKRAVEYPHSLSGGMRQRVLIAIAIACNPQVLIADEPTTALDVTVQAQILDLIKELQSSLQMALLLVTHDLGVVAHMCDEVSVMYAGQIVEEGPSSGLFETPRHPYTSGLLSAMPQSGREGEELCVIPGSIPRPGSIPSGCRFHPRCTHCVDELCTSVPISLELLGGQHSTRCVRVQQGHDLELAGAR